MIYKYQGEFGKKGFVNNNKSVDISDSNNKNKNNSKKSDTRNGIGTGIVIRVNYIRN